MCDAETRTSTLEYIKIFDSIVCGHAIREGEISDGSKV